MGCGHHRLGQFPVHRAIVVRRNLVIKGEGECRIVGTHAEVRQALLRGKDARGKGDGWCKLEPLIVVHGVLQEDVRHHIARRNRDLIGLYPVHEAQTDQCDIDVGSRDLVGSRTPRINLPAVLRANPIDGATIQIVGELDGTPDHGGR